MRLAFRCLLVSILAPVVALIVAGPASAHAQLGSPVDDMASPTVVYLVRHAETEPDGTADPPLSAEGRERAARLVRMVAGAGVTAVHSTPYRRTRGTAERVGAALGLTVQEYDPSDLEAFAKGLMEQGGRHLVVGHSNTTPALVRVLGGDPVGPIPEDDYGRVYVLAADSDGVRTLVTGYPGDLPADRTLPSGGAPEAAAGDVESLESILAATYDVLSGPAGEARDWDRLRSLFLPTARMIPVQRAADGRVVYRPLTVEEYIQSSGHVIEEMGFREVEVARRLERFGGVAHAFSTYEGYREGVELPIMRGLNSIQLIHDGARWWIASIAWAPEQGDLPIPPRYQPTDP